MSIWWQSVKIFSGGKMGRCVAGGDGCNSVRSLELDDKAYQNDPNVPEDKKACTKSLFAAIVSGEDYATACLCVLFGQMGSSHLSFIVLSTLAVGKKCFLHTQPTAFILLKF